MWIFVLYKLEMICLKKCLDAKNKIDDDIYLSLGSILTITIIIIISL